MCTGGDVRVKLIYCETSHANASTGLVEQETAIMVHDNSGMVFNHGVRMNDAAQF